MIKSSTERRKDTISKLTKLGIDFNFNLPFINTSQELTFKSFDDICKRAIASLIAIQAACDIDSDNYDEHAIQFYKNLLSTYDVTEQLTNTELRVMFTPYYNQKDVFAITWTYEAYWALLWALGLVKDITNASEICDCNAAISFVSDCNSYDEFAKQCHPRTKEEILDMLDLYYNYHWACVNHQLHPTTHIGNLNIEIVSERRRGLEWLISTEADWFELSLDT